ncbi:MAG: type II toxin-antitoxin system prevent-host-death family antitoxin [Trueperaceae bacterium]
MKVMTATEASRKFSDLLDAVEAGESVVVTRGGVPVAEIRPSAHRTGRDLRIALEGSVPPDDEFASSIYEALAELINDGADPWAGE